MLEAHTLRFLKSPQSFEVRMPFPQKLPARLMTVLAVLCK